eukprot:1855640-Amphidinium_carterae.2
MEDCAALLLKELLIAGQHKNGRPASSCSLECRNAYPSAIGSGDTHSQPLAEVRGHLLKQSVA